MIFLVHCWKLDWFDFNQSPKSAINDIKAHNWKKNVESSGQKMLHALQIENQIQDELVILAF